MLTARRSPRREVTPHRRRALRRSRPYRGAQDVAKHVLGPVTSDIDQLTPANREVIGLGATVACLGAYTGTAHRSGHRLDLSYLHVWMFTHGRTTGTVET